MLIINKRRKYKLKLETVYFAENYSNYKTDADIVLFYLSNENVPGARAFHTLRIDLTKSEEDIFADFNDTTRRKIHKVSKTTDFDITFFDSPDTKTILEYCENYDEFAYTKGIKPSDRDLLFMAQKTNSLGLSLLKNKEGETLCGIIDIHDSNNTVLLMYSFSHFRRYSENTVRNAISNANRYLHWEVMRRYKALGFSTLDMGGLGMGQETADLDAVDEFKMGFGGKVHTLYHFYYGKTILGKAVLWIKRENRKIEY